MPGPGRRRGMPVDISQLKVKKGTGKRLLKYVFNGNVFKLIVVMICLVINSVASAGMNVVMQRMVDEVITPGLLVALGGNEAWASVLGNMIRLMVLMGTIFGVGVLCGFIYTRLMAIITQRTLKRLRDDMFDNMQTLPIKYFDTHAHGDIMSNYTNDTDATRQMIGQSIPNIFVALISMVSVVGIMLYYSIWMTLVGGIAIFLMSKLTGKFGKRSSKYMISQQKSLAAVEGFTEEMITGLKVVKVFTHEEIAKKDFDKLNEQLCQDGTEANKAGNVLGPIINNVGNISYVLMAMIGGIMFILNKSSSVHFTNISLRGAEDLTLGIMITFLAMFRQLIQVVGQTSQQVVMIAMGMAGAGRCFDLIDEKSETDEGYVELVRCKLDANGNIIETTERTDMWAWKHPHQVDGTVTYTQLKGQIELEEVDFGYVEDKLVLENVSLMAKPGEKFAFVGATGAGKTTITNLINRFYDIPDGKIRFDGINVNKIKKADLRRSLGIVLQDVNLFTGTVMENIRYGRLDATDEECIEAAKLANAHDFISRLPEGYNTMLTGGGSALSQGQRQLLSIARAAVANTPAMILDEATSSIDTRTEALVQDGMDKLMQGRTVFVIAHRLSTVRNSDSIIVLDHGHIIERGTHNELLDKQGTYYRLYTGDFELE